jgi:hypothetical protein
MQVDVARRLPSAATEEEPARAFLQDRIGLWALMVFLLSFGFYVLNLATTPFVQRASQRIADAVLQAGNLDHLAASLVFGATWLATRRVRLSTPALRGLDAVALVVGCTLFAIMGAYMTRLQLAAGVEASIGAYAGLLACASTVTGRATVVPSTAARTLLLSGLAMAPLVPASLAAGSTALTVNVAIWCLVTIAVATNGSAVIFGLRREAARIRRLGQYTLEAPIGAGGMGLVYRARHAMLRRPTAIKLLPPDRSGEAAIARFEREVQLTAQLSHPNTVAIYDYGRTPDGLFYYAMELLEGVDLDALVRLDGPQPPGRVVAILTQVCGSLAEAHGCGLVHRDVKPANIILTERGGVPDVAKVVDFGLVRPIADDPAGLTLSVTGLLAGTPLYMSPESMTAPDTGDPRSDLYALGAVAYFLLTGRPVFEAGSLAEVVAAHLHTEPAPPSARLGRPLPGALEALVLECLRKRPQDRPQSALDLRAALGRCAVEPWTQADAEAWWRRFRETRPAAAPGPGSPASAPTVTVDLADRLAGRGV